MPISINLSESTKSSKILLILSIIALLSAICIPIFFIYKQIKQQESLIIEQKELLDKVTRSMSIYATKKDIENIITDNKINLKNIQDDLDKLHAEIKSINIVTANSNGFVGENIPGNISVKNPDPPKVITVDCNGKEIPCPNQDPYGYLLNRNDFTLYEPFNQKVPIGTVGFSAWKKEPWYISISPREYKLINVVGVDENQRQYFYNKFIIKVDNKDYDINITNATTKQEYPTSKFRWFSPRLFFGIDMGYNLVQSFEFTPSLNVGIMSLGQYINQPDFSIIQLGIGFGTVSKKAHVSLTPVMYNIGKHIPLMNNLYVGPSVHLNSSNELLIMGGFRVAL
jgi:hypothetical protein